MELLVNGLTHMDTLGLPIVSFLMMRRLGDHRGVIADSSDQFVKDSPFLIVSVLNIKHT
jgi:hypothetical protein